MTNQSKYDALIEAGSISQRPVSWSDNLPEIMFTLLGFVVLALLVYLVLRIRRKAARLVMSRLSRPINRTGFALLAVCCGTFFVALLMAAIDGDGGRLLARVLDPGEPSYDSYDYLARYSLGGGVLGAWFAWGYEPTFGRLIQWIKNG